jgi:hypothetical protein
MPAQSERETPILVLAPEATQTSTRFEPLQEARWKTIPRPVPLPLPLLLLRVVPLLRLRRQAQPRRRPKKSSWREKKKVRGTSSTSMRFTLRSAIFHHHQPRHRRRSVSRKDDRARRMHRRDHTPFHRRLFRVTI